MPATDTGDRVCSGNIAGDDSGVARVLDDEDELPDEEDGRLFVEESELKDDARDVEEQERDDGDNDVSDVARLTPRCAMF